MNTQVDTPELVVAEEPIVPPEVAAAIANSGRRRSAARLRDTLIVRAGQVGSVLLLLGLWEYVVRQGLVRELFISRPSAVAAYFVNKTDLLLSSSKETFLAAFMGFLIGSVGGIAIGVLLSRSRTLERIFDPWVSFLASLPRIALAPLFLLWFGITFEAKVALAVSVVLFVVLVGAQAGIKGADPDIVRAIRLLGGNERQVFFKVVLPSAVPSMFGALRLAVIFSILGVVASEMVASRAGLGQRIVRSSQELEPEGVFAILIILGVVATGLNAVLQMIEERLLRWKGGDH